MSEIILSADSTCDLSPELNEEFGVHTFACHVNLDGEQYKDMVDLTPDDIYQVYKKKGVLPTTSAVNAAEYGDYFKTFTDQGLEVVHFVIGSGLSIGYRNAVLAAESLPGVYVIDSRSLSTGSALSVLEAAKRIKAGMPAARVAEEVQALTARVRASFVLDTLEFLYKGGRCSALAMLGANILKLRPCIEVSPEDGKMGVGKKYRGTLDAALTQYVKDKLDGVPGIDKEKIFITHSGIAEERIELVKREIAKYARFEHVYVTRAGCSVTTHCGPNTLGILFLMEE